jgi:hypothetical protein
VLFDDLPVNAYQAHKLTEMLSAKDGSMKRQKYVFLGKNSNLEKKTVN